MIELNQIPLEVTHQINYFRNFLIAAWPFLDKMMKNHDWDSDVGFTHDWIQANWEFLVERELLGSTKRLFPLGWSKRVTDQKSTVTHKVICQVEKSLELRDWNKKTLNYQGEELLPGGFCSPYDITYGLYPPFDYVNLYTLDRKKLYIIPFDNCKFYLQPI